MGLIIRQGFKSGVVTYAAVALGLINNVFIYPRFLELNELGVIQFVLQTSILLVPFLILGYTSVSAKFYPHYKDTAKGRSQFFTFLLLAPVVGTLLLFGFVGLQGSQIEEFYKDTPGVDLQVIYIVCLVASLMVFNSTLSAYSANLKRIAIPTLLNNLIKCSLPVFCILYFLGVWEFESIYYGLIGHYFFLLLAFSFYLFRLDNIRIDFGLITTLKMSRWSEMLGFALFGILAGVGTTLATKIDTFMITSFSSNTTYDTGLYSFALFTSNTVALPIAIVSGLATPLIANYWKENNLKEIDKIYKQSSLNMLLTGSAILIALIYGIRPLFEVMPKGDEYSLSINAVYILAFARILDLLAGLNSQVLSMSARYKVFFYFLVFLSISNVALNLYFIPKWGVEGAALATFISIALFNLLKFIYLKIKYDLQPFSIQTIKSVALIAVLLCGVLVTPDLTNPWLNALIWPSVALVVYLGLIHYLRLSPEISNFIDQRWKQIRAKVTPSK